MKRLAAILIISLMASAASADVWKWTDANGDVHFVDSTRPIYTWQDATGRVFFADKPEHPYAKRVELVWHSAGSLEDFGITSEGGAKRAAVDPDETDEERAEREAAEAYYCKKATEVVAKYEEAPSLYRTNAAGEREMLSEEEAAATIADAERQREIYCKE